MQPQKYSLPLGAHVTTSRIVPTKYNNLPTHILLAEDDIDEQGFFTVAVNDLSIPIRLQILDDGTKLLKYLFQKHVDLPQIIFLDIIMPNKNGIECLKEIKSNEQLKKIPIIMYSNSTHDDYIVKTYEYGHPIFCQRATILNLLKVLANYSLLSVVKLNRLR